MRKFFFTGGLRFILHQLFFIQASSDMNNKTKKAAFTR